MISGEWRVKFSRRVYAARIAGLLAARCAAIGWHALRYEGRGERRIHALRTSGRATQSFHKKP
jgi:hypothetical protein